MTYNVERAAVIGAGVMGAGIAAHLANVGIPTLLMDIVPTDAQGSKDHATRSRVATTGIDRQLKAKPAPGFYTPRSAALVTPGNIEDDLPRLSGVDLVIEAVFERLDIKRDLYDKIEPILGANTIITSNTSGLPARLLLEGRNEKFQRQFLITHFFNPVRFLKLLELVPGEHTDPALLAFMQAFGAGRLGKGIVVCKDTPNFIANRLGSYGFCVTIRHALDEGYKIEEVDAIFGEPLGRAKSAVFRTADIAGIDTLVHVADNLYENLPNDPQREVFKIPDFVREMVKRGWTGEKGGQGFYKRVKDAEGQTQILVIDPATLEYHPQDKVRFESIGKARNNPDVSERAKIIMSSDDRAGTLAWEVTADTLAYAAEHASEIAHNIVDIDRAMRWGFNWEQGTFESWDALGAEWTAERMQREGRPLPQLLKDVLATPEQRFYPETQTGQQRYFDFSARTFQPVTGEEGLVRLATLRKNNQIVAENASASLLDMGDGVLCVEFHAKMNALDEDMGKMMAQALEEAQKNFRALVIGNEAPDFSAGANIFALVMAAKTGQWEVIDQQVRGLQDLNMAMKYSQTPVVVAAAGRTLGGGAEIVMHSSKARLAAETYIGLVETGVGLLPAGGGCKEMLARWSKTREKGPFPPVRRAFELIATATVSTSAAQAQDYRFMRKEDAITLDRERLLTDAKADAVALAEAKARGAWQPPTPPTFHLPGPGARTVLEEQARGLHLQGLATEHDLVVASQVARVLTGGETSFLREMSEQDILDLEREGFLSLLGTEKTQERIAYTLTTGKPLRN
ncbi:MAG TPA: 3-hydroxyacyl-CoA dehydrogenase/enoyl-CoA hydratase family protein [Ktedonobacterales bacterium]|nr:3-hydroxyacyl-CoA dehydrogenase/enoyl-CoA hydratase family protein [Ktedonobacterales bacterium]